MDPITATVLILCLLVAGGGGVGVGIAIKSDSTAKALEAQAATLEEQGKAIALVAEQAGRPVVIDAELRSTLAEVPVQCRTDAGGDPTSIFCTWASCNAYSQSAANRPECSEITKAIVAHHRAEDERAEAH